MKICASARRAEYFAAGDRGYPVPPAAGPEKLRLSASSKPVHNSQRDAGVAVAMVEEVCAQHIDLRASAEMLREEVISASAQHPGKGVVRLIGPGGAHVGMADAEQQVRESVKIVCALGTISEAWTHVKAMHPAMHRVGTFGRITASVPRLLLP
jgi:hypothetical protein